MQPMTLEMYACGKGEKGETRKWGWGGVVSFFKSRELKKRRNQLEKKDANELFKIKQKQTHRSLSQIYGECGTYGEKG